jgi:Domain of unknown function (DUF6647)
MEALLTAIVLWISANFDLPAKYDHPKIEIVPATEIAALRYGTFAPEKHREILSLDRNTTGSDVVAIYDSTRKTILLPMGWTSGTPAEVSVLVHEVVHHLQSAANLTYECPAAREELAYAAQEKWLGLFGRSLLSEFDIDPFTLKIKTVCGY